MPPLPGDESGNHSVQSQMLVQTLSTFFAEPFGRVTQVKVYTSDYQQLSWREVWDALAEVYPDQWAVELFPPARDLVDEANVYHLWLMPQDWAPPPRMNLAENYH